MNERLGYVYAHKKASSGQVFYVGLGGFALSEPKDSYRRAYKLSQRNAHHARVAKKHGVLVEILVNNLTLVQAKNLEKELITQFNLYKTGANRTLGGDGTVGYSHTAEAKLQTSQATNERFLNSSWKEMWVARCQSSRVGKPKRVLSDEVKCKIAKSNLGKIHSEETKVLLAQKARIQCTGAGNPNFKGRCFTPYGIFENARCAAEALNTAYSTITNRCKKSNTKRADWYFEKDQNG